MAHWIIEGSETSVRNYRCSSCGASWSDIHRSPKVWHFCPSCYSNFDEEAEYVVKEEKQEEPSYAKELADLGKYVAEGFAAGLKSGGFTVIPNEKYNEIVSDLVKLGEDLEVANRDKERCLDILKRLGIDEDNAKRIIPDTGEIIDNRINPRTMRRKIILGFEVDDDRR